MRRYKKSQIIEIIKALGYVNELILDNKEKINSSELVSILTDCQQKALEVGNFIESEVKENLSTVHLLEDYCELLYQISINHTQRRQLCKKTRIVINNIAKSIRKDIPDSNKVIVFLPYMVSMWDSLESVWMAAKEDKDCECYVIPIPYYDKNPDGSLGEMHYEGNDYPDYVNIVQWQEYNMTEQHPDIIYIHNPYDDYNHVTTIHPNYYAKKLKKCTDMLVYIPYFVSSFDNVPAHFCVLPGTIYADKVIVQSENIRQIYIREFFKLKKENDNKRFYEEIDSKFLALGSPKFDKIIELSDENIKLPTDWLEQLCILNN